MIEAIRSSLREGRGRTWLLFSILALAAGLLAAASALATGRDCDKRKLARAEMQYQIVVADIEKGDFDGVFREMKKIYDLGFSPACQRHLTEAIEKVSDMLRHKKQLEVARKVVDEGLKHIEVKSLQARLYRELAYIYQKQGQLDKAKENFRRALELDEQQ